MDFLKGLFSSKQEDQSVNDINITESGSSEPASEEPMMPEMPQEPQAPESSETIGGSEDSSFQE